MELYTDSNEAFVLAKQFVHDMGCNTLDISFTNEKLEAAMQAEIDERKIKCPHLQRTLHIASSLIEVCWISFNLRNFNKFLLIHRLDSMNAHSKRRKPWQCFYGKSLSEVLRVAYIYHGGHMQLKRSAQVGYLRGRHGP